MSRRSVSQFVHAVVVAALVLAAYALGRRVPPTQRPLLQLPHPPASLSHHDTGPTIEQVKRLSLLTVTRVDVADVLESRLNGYTGGVRAAVLVKGDLSIAVDLSRARFESKDERLKAAVLWLPRPEVTRPRLDQEKTKLFELSSYGLWQVVPGDAGRAAVVNAGYRHAQQIVTAAGNDPKLVEQSRRNAEESLTCFFQAVGWTVTIRWGTSDLDK